MVRPPHSSLPPKPLTHSHTSSAPRPHRTVIRAGLLTGKLSQTAQTLHVTRASPRAFEREQWVLLEKRLHAWKAGLASVLETVAASRKKSGGAGAVAAAVTATAADAAAPAGIETPAAAAQAAVA